jgi:hypothetical protein
MEYGGVAQTEPMPRLVGGNTETVCGKLKSGNRFLKPNFGLGPKLGNGPCCLNNDKIIRRSIFV